MALYVPEELQAKTSPGSGPECKSKAVTSGAFDPSDMTGESVATLMHKFMSCCANAFEASCVWPSIYKAVNSSDLSREW